MIMPSAAAVPSSRREALAISRPVREVVRDWKLMRDSRRPWEISACRYGMLAVRTMWALDREEEEEVEWDGYNGEESAKGE
jgi:hypothetical protein